MPTSATAALRARSKTSLIGRHFHQHVALLAAFGEERRMHQQGAAAKPLGKPRREMIDIGVEFALHAAGQRHDGHVEGALRLQVLDHRTHRLAAGDRDDVSVAQRLQQHDWRPHGRPAAASCRGCRGRSAPRRWLDRPPASVRRFSRSTSGWNGLSMAIFTMPSLRPWAISRFTFDGDRLSASRDVGLLHTIDEMQHQHRVDLADCLEIFLVLSHGKCPT